MFGGQQNKFNILSKNGHFENIMLIDIPVNTMPVDGLARIDTVRIHMGPAFYNM